MSKPSELFVGFFRMIHPHLCDAMQNCSQETTRKMQTVIIRSCDYLRGAGRFEECTFNLFMEALQGMHSRVIYCNAWQIDFYDL